MNEGRNNTPELEFENLCMGTDWQITGGKGAITLQSWNLAIYAWEKKKPRLTYSSNQNTELSGYLSTLHHDKAGLNMIIRRNNTQAQ